MLIPDNGNGNGVSGWKTGAYWTMIAVAVSAFGYAWYLASAQGTMQNEINDQGRRMQVIEQYGSPALGALKTESDYDNRRLTVLEHDVATRIPELIRENATQTAGLVAAQLEILRLREWRVAASLEDVRTAAKIADLAAKVGQLEAAHTAFQHWKDENEARDHDTAIRLGKVEASGVKSP